MSKKPVRNTSLGGQILTRRAALAYGAFAATSLYLPGGLIRSAYAQSVSFDYYIGPNGSDSNPGTQSQPWSITAINTKRSTYAGKTVGLLDGTYDLIAIMGQPGGNFSTGVLKIAGGSASSPTVIRAVNPRKAIIDWNRAAQTNGSEGSTFQPSGSYVTIDGLVLANNNYRTIINYDGGGDNFTIKNCHFVGQSFAQGSGGGKNSCMIYTQNHDNILISNCRFEGGGAPIDGNRHACIQSYQTSRNVVIEFCSFIAGPGTGNLIHFKQGGNYSPVVRNCYMNRSASTNNTSQYVILFQGQNTDPGDHAQIHNNVFISGGSHTIFYLEDPGFAGTLDIHHNTFVGPWAGGCFAHMDRGSPVQTNIYENVWNRVSGGGGQYGDVGVYSTSTIGQMDRNYYPSSPVVGVGAGTFVTGLASWQAMSGKDLSSLSGSDAGFIAQDSDAAFYRIKSGSPSKTLGAGGAEIGAWGGANQVGSSFGGGVVLPVPVAPQLIDVG